jgi:hypothetical protein
VGNLLIVVGLEEEVVVVVGVEVSSRIAGYYREKVSRIVGY